MQLGGVASRLEALDRLTTSSDAISMASLFIVLLFIAIETAPIFVKLISTKGPYDYVLETAEHKFETEAISDKAYIHDQLKKRSEKLASRDMFLLVGVSTSNFIIFSKPLKKTRFSGIKYLKKSES